MQKFRASENLVRSCLREESANVGSEQMCEQCRPNKN